MKKFKGLIFDFNGVLLLDQPLHDQTWNDVMREITGKVATDEEIKNVFHGRTNRSILEYLFDRPISRDELETWMTKKESSYQALATNLGKGYAFAPGAIGLINSLRAHMVPYTIATSSPAMNIRFFEEKLHLSNWFDIKKIAFDDGTLRGKPAPDLYLRAAHLLALPPADCVVIEDARSGIAAAHAAGIGHIIAIGPKETHKRLRAVDGVNEVVENLTEVDAERLFELPSPK